MKSNEHMTTIPSTHENLGYKKGVFPVIEETYGLPNGHIETVVSDGAENSLCLCLRGRTPAKSQREPGDS
ncbi:MAG: hypothetical protein EAX95_06585 [Candidatus Thorarchaeota archaeon]|nr:hypothetical protein [Candidatus Thorarchaeota archaeon]